MYSVVELRRTPTGESWLNILLIVGTVALAVDCLYLASIPPATGFENSLINAYPPGFWAAFAVGIAAVIVVFAGNSVTESGHWRPAFGLLAAFYGLFFFLPLHRGYHLYGRESSDALAHLGIVKRMIEAGVVDTFYPLEHLLLTQLATFGVAPRVSRYLVPLVFTLVFIASIGVLLRSLTGRSFALSAGFCVATPLVFTYHQIQISPYLLSFILVPTVLFLVDRTRQADDWRYRVGYLLLGFGIVFFHPMTTVFVIILLVSTLLVGRGFEAIASSSETTATLSTRMATLAGLFMLWWYTPFRRTQTAILSIIVSLDGAQGNLVSDQSQQLESASLTLVEVLQRIVTKYGVIFVMLGLAGLYSVMVLYNIYRRDAWYPDVLGTTQYAIGGGLAVLFLTVYLIAFDPVRVSRYFVFGAIILVALLLLRATIPWRNADGLPGLSKNTVVLPVVVACIIIAAVLGSFAGTTYWPNKQMTDAEYQGSEFVIEHDDPAVDVHGHSLHSKMQWFVTGTRSEPGEGPVLLARNAVPRHLGYDENDTAGTTFGRAHVVTQAYDIQYSQADYFTAEQQRNLFIYDETAIRRLEGDTTVDRVYANGGYTVWNVDPPDRGDDE